jgi:WD40 repeat protein
MKRQTDRPSELRKEQRSSLQERLLILFIVILLFLLLSVTILIICSFLNVISPFWSKNLSTLFLTVILPVLAVLLPTLQWLHSLRSTKQNAAGGALVSQPASFVVATDHVASLQEKVPTLIASEQVKVVAPPEREESPAPCGALRENWYEAPQIGQLYGRQEELVELEHWVVDDRCRVVALLGIGGVGKTTLAVALADKVKYDFAFVYWRSVQNIPPIENILNSCIQFFSHQQLSDISLDIDEKISLLLKYFREQRCLLILDNIESLLQEGSRAGQYRMGYEGYAKLIKRIGEGQHQSCLILTSREKPREIAQAEGNASPVRSLYLTGLEQTEGQEVLRDRNLHGSEEDWVALVELYSGNPLALKLVAGLIREVFSGDIARFLLQGQSDIGDLKEVLAQQFQRLSALEQTIIYWLAIEREAAPLEEIQENMAQPVSLGVLVEAINSLRWRSMIEAGGVGRFLLQPVIMEYVTHRFIEQVKEEIETGHFDMLAGYTLIKAQAKDYIRESQMRLFLTPIVEWIHSSFGKEESEGKVKDLLPELHTLSTQKTGYAAGNLLNLLIAMGSSLKGTDFSHLTLRQAYLQGAELPGVNFAYSTFAQSVFTDTFGGILCISISPNGNFLAAGTNDGDIWLWQMPGAVPLLICRGHTDWVQAVSFSPDSRVLASGSGDQSVRLWDVNTGACLAIMRGHTYKVQSVIFSPDGSMLASGSSDRTIRLWKVESRECLKVLSGHTDWLRTVTFSPDGSLLASGGDDGSIKLWEVQTGRCVRTLPDHKKIVASLRFSPDGRLLVSGSADLTVSIWEVSSWTCLNVLRGHTQKISSVAFRLDGNMIASGSEDQSVRLWEVSSGECLKVLQGHRSWVSSVAFGLDGTILVSGSEDQSVRLWDISSGRCIKTLQGYSSRMSPAAFSPDGSLLAAADKYFAVWLWNVSSGECTSALKGHTNIVQTIAFSPDGSILASGSGDMTVRLWDCRTGQCLRILKDHTDRVKCVTFSPDGGILASCGDDQSIRLWEVSSGRCLRKIKSDAEHIESLAFCPDGSCVASCGSDHNLQIYDVNSGTCMRIFQGHTEWVIAVTFSADGKLLISGADDHNVRIWDVESGECLKIIPHPNAVWSVALHPQGNMIASGGSDRLVRLWEVSSGKILKLLEAHTSWIFSVAFSPDGETLASSSHDGTAKLWNLQTGKCLKTLKGVGPYEGMNITQVKGLTEVQKATLKMLGAIELDS